MITIGADPELFLSDNSGKLIPACGLIGGTKRHPTPMEREGFYIQEDNVAVEFNIPPASNVLDFLDSIQWSLDEIMRRVAILKMAVKPVSVHQFSDDDLKHPQARTFGCEPDFNAWNKGDRNPKIIPTIAGNMRTCGGHGHIGYPEKDDNNFRIRLIQACDWTLGVPSIIMDRESIERRRLYGQAGCFRPTTYGAEYRVLSNFWLKSRELTQWFYNGLVKAYELVKHSSMSKLLDQEGQHIQNMINHDLTIDAKHFIEKYNIACV